MNYRTLLHLWVVSHLNCLFCFVLCTPLLIDFLAQNASSNASEQCCVYVMNIDKVLSQFAGNTIERILQYSKHQVQQAQLEKNSCIRWNFSKIIQNRSKVSKTNFSIYQQQPKKHSKAFLP